MAAAPDVDRIIADLTPLQVMGLRTAQTHDLPVVDGAWSPTTPYLNCPGNVTRELVRKGLAVHGGAIGPARATVLNATGEHVRRAILARDRIPTEGRNPMSDTRARLTEAFNAILAETAAKLPESMFLNIPVGKLVDAAHKVYGDIPRPPAYDPEVTPKREFFGMLSRDAATAGHTNDRAHVEPAEADYGVTLHVLDGRTGVSGEARLPRRDAEQFFLNGLSVVAFQDAEERREADGG